MGHACQLCGFEEASQSAAEEDKKVVTSAATKDSATAPCSHAFDDRVGVKLAEQPGPSQTRPSTACQTRKPCHMLAGTSGGGYSPSYAWGCSRLQRVAKEEAERQAVQETIKEVKASNAALVRELSELRATSQEQTRALKDHLSHTEAQLAAEKERSFALYQAHQTAKESLEHDRAARHTAVRRATAALTRLGQEEAHWREVSDANKSLQKDLNEARVKLEALREVEKQKALLEESISREKQRRESAEETLQGLERDKEQMRIKLNRFKGVEVVLRETEGARDHLQKVLQDVQEDLATAHESAHVANAEASTLQRDNSELRDNLARLEALYEVEKARNDELEQLLEKVLRKRAEAEQQRRVLKQELETSRAEKAQADARVERLTSMLEEARKGQETAEKSEKGCREKLQNVQKDAQKLASLLASAGEELRTLDNECESFCEQRVVWQSTAQELSTTKQRLQEAESKLCVELKAAMAAREDTNRLRLENEKLTSSLELRKEEVKRLAEQLGKFKDELLASRAETEGVKKAVDWAERRADDARKAADVAADQARADRSTAEKLSTEIDDWKERHVQLEGEIEGHVAAREQQLEAAVKREAVLRDEFEEKERRWLAKMDTAEKQALEALEKAQSADHERTTLRAELERSLEKARTLEIQARDSQEALHKASRAREEADARASKGALDAAAARKKAATLKKENAAMMANYDAWLRTLVKKSKVSRPLSNLTRAELDRMQAVRFSSPERDIKRETYHMLNRDFDPVASIKRRAVGNVDSVGEYSSDSEGV